MRSDRGRRDRPGRRTYRPTVDESLERRELMSGGMISPRAAFFQRRAMLAQQLGIGQRGAVETYVTAAGGAVTVTDTDGERYRVEVSGNGSVAATPLPDGRVGLVVRGTNTLSEIDVIPLPRLRTQNGAHTFGPYKSFGDGVLDIGLLDVYGPVSGIFGFNTARLNGPLMVRDTAPVNRIALSEVGPNASIAVGGDLNQLEILRNAHFVGSGSGINVGQDLNVLNVGGFLTFSEGASARVGRDVGLITQPPAGTGQGGRGARIDGGVFIGEGSQFVIGRRLSGPFLVLGDFVGRSRLQIGDPNSQDQVAVVGTVVP